MAFKCKIGLHAWKGCKCIDCGKFRDEQHSFNGCICLVCGKEKEHIWYTINGGYKCADCGKESNELIYTDKRDGQVYQYIKIGKQFWMKANFRYKADTGCWAYNYNENFVAKYGYLYNWYTAKRICPEGWQLPSSDDWNLLMRYLGGSQVAGGKLKESSIDNWLNPNTAANNESGFTALPGGIRDVYGNFVDIGKRGAWWSETESGALNAQRINIEYNSNKVERTFCMKDLGFSVRLMKY